MSDAAPLRTVEAILTEASVIPVLSIERVEDAAPLAQSLVEGGLRVVEATLRTPAGLEAMAAMKAAQPSLIVGMGSIKSPDDAHRSVEAGADFLVTPGVTASLLDALEALETPALPGAATVSEAMALLERGFSAQKFFPAEASGGVSCLKAMAGPLPMIRFCPTGGVSAANAPAYLTLPNVACVGGSWIAPPDVIAAQDWARITQTARAASALATPETLVNA